MLPIKPLFSPRTIPEVVSRACTAYEPAVGTVAGAGQAAAGAATTVFFCFYCCYSCAAVAAAGIETTT